MRDLGKEVTVSQQTSCEQMPIIWSLRFLFYGRRGAAVCPVPVNLHFSKHCLLIGINPKGNAEWPREKTNPALPWEHLVKHTSQDSPYGGYFLENTSLLCLQSSSELVGEEWEVMKSESLKRQSLHWHPILNGAWSSGPLGQREKGFE